MKRKRDPKVVNIFKKGKESIKKQQDK